MKLKASQITLLRVRVGTYVCIRLTAVRGEEGGGTVSKRVKELVK